MSVNRFIWRGREISFRPGESIAAALEAAGIVRLGLDALGQETRYFCGIGACQSCLVRVDGTACEACLTPARSGMTVTPLEDRS
ncbi:2Fe-2S iron-sulfur cluster-binding protein [Neorhizobium petrolearium]|uniref:2Fe-2S iron-sulfur cluster-binding protein n=1 Tax=Neorhizobium petrolearium TaxID=515361 RepID=UPI003F80BC07